MRFTQPMIGIHTQLGKLEAHSTPARLHSEFRQARSNKHWTQPELEIDQYPSRHAYGNDNHIDFAKKYGQQGFADLAKTTSRWTQEAWDNVENCGKRGRNPVVQRYDNKLQQEINKQRQIVTELIPDPVIKFHPIEAVGQPDVGDVTVDIQTDAFAQTNFTRGQVETYMQQKANVQRWVTEGKYDIYA
ncbi:hypothetical protein SAMN05216582_11350 [Selenomonas ruminantium]|uniref:Uncharacterized protein n=2 Tax=Selenomonas ruminantium TaxID=971 RepID=A0A1M6UMS6_SELRU|nr:hypothetical protein SAMN05216582_11350 [Selenomonas ruminantium]